jgi:hypothetical protein
LPFLFTSYLKIEMNIILEDECCAFFCEIGEEDVYSDVCTKDEKKLWDNGTVPYKFDRNISVELQKIVKEAMKRITEVSSIVFEERKDQKDYIKIVDEDKFWSWVGKKGGRQVIIIYNTYFGYSLNNSHLFISQT